MLKLMFVHMNNAWLNHPPPFKLFAVKCEQHTSRQSVVAGVSDFQCFCFAHLSGTSPLAAELNKLIIVCLKIHTSF